MVRRGAKASSRAWLLQLGARADVELPVLEKLQVRLRAQLTPALPLVWARKAAALPLPEAVLEVRKLAAVVVSADAGQSASLQAQTLR